MIVTVIATTSINYVVSINGNTASFSVSASASASGDANNVSVVVDEASRTSQIQAYLLAHKVLEVFELEQIIIAGGNVDDILNNYLNTTGIQTTATTTTVQTLSE